jgi:NifU-like protein involved in Fe-S cluster formation
VIDDLYSARILGLAANMPCAGRLPKPQATAERASRLCGSRVIVDVVVADGRIVAFAQDVRACARLCGSRVVVDVMVADGKIVAFAQDVRACALGQAAAAILGDKVIGARIEEVEAARDALRTLLKTGEGAPQPHELGGRFADLAVLAQVKDYPARHASTLLAFEAAAEAAREAAEAVA